MKAHKLAKKLLALPNHEVMIRDSLALLECGTPQEYIITDDDADNCGDCEGIVGETVIVMCI